jgi:isopenicillin-N N-acyltransferase-like protein
MSFEIIEVSGEAFRRGKLYGERAKSLIRKNAEYYLKFWKSHLGIDDTSLKDAYSQFSSSIESYDEEIFREMEGIAEGSGVPLETIVLLNSRYELGWLGEALKSRGCITSEGCTSLGVLPERAGGKTYVAQNWDYKEHFLQTTVILKIRRDDLPDIITKTEAGAVTQQGLNSEGIAVAMNALVSTEDSFGEGIPVIILMRRILDSQDFSSALKYVYEAKTNVSSNFIIGAPGEIINLEMTPKGVSYIFPKGGIITHSNHFLKAHFEHPIKDRFISVIPDTLFRHERAKRILNEAKEVTFDRIKITLSDHFNYPNSICRHRDERVEEFTRLVTVSSLVMDLSAKILFVTKGNPCENEYVAISF